MLTKFGPERVRDTTIAEAGFFGAAVGAAMTGLRPIVELMYVDFAGVCFDQLMNQAAKMRYMFGGKQNVPMVVRTVVGAGFRAGSEHSQTLYSLYTHIPGLKVVAPYDAIDAKGLLLSSIIDNDPVIFMEHKRLYMTKCEVPENLKPIPLGKGRIRKKGKDITIVAIQRMNLFAEEAANLLSEEDIECEIIDRAWRENWVKPEINTNKSGKIINVASGLGFRGANNNYMYGAAKGGVVNLTRVLTNSLSRHGINVSCIVPGFISTDVDRDHRSPYIPIGRTGYPVEIGPLAVYLASDASNYVSGNFFTLDGGGLAGGIAPTGFSLESEISL